MIAYGDEVAGNSIIPMLQALDSVPQEVTPAFRCNHITPQLKLYYSFEKVLTLPFPKAAVFHPYWSQTLVAASWPKRGNVILIVLYL